LCHRDHQTLDLKRYLHYGQAIEVLSGKTNNDFAEKCGTFKSRTFCRNHCEWQFLQRNE